MAWPAAASPRLARQGLEGGGAEPAESAFANAACPGQLFRPASSKRVANRPRPGAEAEGLLCGRERQHWLDAEVQARWLGPCCATCRRRLGLG